MSIWSRVKPYIFPSFDPVMDFYELADAQGQLIKGYPVVLAFDAAVPPESTVRLTRKAEFAGWVRQFVLHYNGGDAERGCFYVEHFIVGDSQLHASGVPGVSPLLIGMSCPINYEPFGVGTNLGICIRNPDTVEFRTDLVAIVDLYYPSYVNPGAASRSIVFRP